MKTDSGCSSKNLISSKDSWNKLWVFYRSGTALPGKSPRIIKTRQSSCMNARGIPSTAYQALHMLSYLRGGGTYLSQGGGTYLGWGAPALGYPPIWTWLGYPPPCEQTENITFPHPSNVVSNNNGGTFFLTMPYLLHSFWLLCYLIAFGPDKATQTFRWCCSYSRLTEHHLNNGSLQYGTPHTF